LHKTNDVYCGNKDGVVSTLLLLLPLYSWPRSSVSSLLNTLTFNPDVFQLHYTNIVFNGSDLQISALLFIILPIMTSQAAASLSESQDTVNSNGNVVEINVSFLILDDFCCILTDIKTDCFNLGTCWMVWITGGQSVEARYA
jgi:hypothetical protein